MKKICSMQKKMESVKKLSEALTGTEYTIKYGYVDVTEDDYEKGEGDFVKNYTISDTGLANTTYSTLTELIANVAKHAIYDDRYKDPKMWQAFAYEETKGILRIDTNVTTDKQDMPADDHDIELWKDGKLKLYNSHYAISVRCSYTSVIPKDLIETETEELGMDTLYME